MDVVTSTPGLVALGFLVLSFLVKWLFGRVEKTLDAMLQKIETVVSTVSLQATQIGKLEIRVDALERQVERK